MALRASIAVLLVAVTVVSAGCLGVTSSGPTQLGAVHSGTDQVSTGPGKTVSVFGSGEASTAPDQTVMTVAVTGTGSDASSVRDDVASRSNELVSALRNAGVPKDGIVTSYYFLSDVSRPDSSTPEYRAVHAFQVTLDGTDRAGEIVDVATSHGADQVSSVQFTLSDEARKSLRAEALRAAMANARSDADVLASESNLSITGVHRVSTSNYTPGPVVYASGSSAGGTTVPAKTSFSPGPVTVHATVSVTYDAE